MLEREICSLEADRDAADAREQQLRFELSDKQVSMARAAVQSQQQLSDKLVAENKMEDAVKQAQRLSLERDSVTAPPHRLSAGALTAVCRFKISVRKLTRKRRSISNACCLPPRMSKSCTQNLSLQWR